MPLGRRRAQTGQKLAADRRRPAGDDGPLRPRPRPHPVSLPRPGGHVVGASARISGSNCSTAWAPSCRAGPPLHEQVERLLDSDELRFTTVRRLLRRVRDAGLDLVLTLDEFEGLARNPNFEPDFYGELRSLAGEMGIVYLTASKRGLYELTYHHTETLSSPFFNIFSELTLGLLPEADARGLLETLSAQGEGPGFCAEEIDLALELAGPHPFFLQIAGYSPLRAAGPGRAQVPRRLRPGVHALHRRGRGPLPLPLVAADADEQQALLSPNAASESQRKTLLAKALIRAGGPALRALWPRLCRLSGGQARRRAGHAHRLDPRRDHARPPT